MELIEARALKSSFISGMSLKPTLHQVFLDDLWCVAGINGVSGDDFSVDDLLDFSGEDFIDDKSHDSGEDEEKDSLSESSQNRSSEISTFSGTESLGTISSGELPVPVDDFENLEWLSQFVDESTSEFSLLCPVGAFNDKTGSFAESYSEPVNRPLVQKITVPCFPVTFPVKSRTKRSRPAGKRTWSLSSPTVSSDSSYGSSPSSSYGSSPFTYDLFCSVEKPPPAKKPKKKLSSPETNSGGVPVQRRCSHCQVQKTPQWRTGPSRPKTLCNACGVRYKSGRLFPEYRPACSPTFSQEVHSNSHRKVIEMRQKKVVVVAAEVVEPGLTLVC